MISQATNTKDRYKPIGHQTLQVGDLVLLKEPLLKPANYPMGIVREVVYNDLNEVTAATVTKGGTSESVRRHVDALVPHSQ